MTAARPEVVALWHRRARAYDQLVRRHPIFTRFADRLVEALPPDAREVLDVGGGTGLVSERLHLARPGLRLHLCEPAVAMRALAVERLGSRLASCHALAAEDVDQLEFTVDAALANVSLHLSDVPRSLRAIRTCLAPGGVLLFNLWAHDWAPTADEPDHRPLWRAPLQAALGAAGLDRVQLPPETERRAPLEPAALRATAQAAGLELEVLPSDRDRVPGAFFVEFAAMDATLLADVEPRAAVFEHARALAADEVVVTSTRLRLTRRR